MIWEKHLQIFRYLITDKLETEVEIMEAQYFVNKKIIRFQNIMVTTKRWKALIVLPWCPKSIKKERQKIKSIWMINSILN